MSQRMVEGKKDTDKDRAELIAELDALRDVNSRLKAVVKRYERVAGKKDLYRGLYDLEADKESVESLQIELRKKQKEIDIRGEELEVQNEELRVQLEEINALNLVARMNATLQESEERLKLAQHVARVGTFEWNIRTGVNKWTPELEALYGLRPGSFPGTEEAWEQLVHPADRPEAVRRVNEAMEKGGFEGEWRVVWPDGTVHWLHGRAFVFKDESGKPLKLIGVNIDITERKCMEEELRRSRDEFEERVKGRTAELLKIKEELGQRVTERTGELLAAHQSLVEKSRFLDVFFNHTITPLVLLDRDFNFIRVNEAYARACQKEVDEFPGHNHFEFYPSDARTIFEDVIRTRLPFQVAARPFVFTDHPDWGVTYWDWTLTPLLDDRGDVEALVFALEDVTEFKRAEIELKKHRDKLREMVEERTRDLEAANNHLRYEILERKRAEETLRESEANLERAQEIAHIGSWLWDISTNKLLWSDEQYRVFGLAKDCEPTYELYLGRVHPDDRQYIIDAINKSISNKTPCSVDYRIVRPDDEIRFIHGEGRVTYDGEKPVCMVGTIQDITERKRTEEALRNSERLYRAIGESIDYGVWVCTPDGRNIYASESFLKLVGLTQEHCSDFGWGDVLHPDDAGRTIAAWKECVCTGGTWDIEHRYRGVDGRYHPILARGVPVKDEQGKIIYWAGINLDISKIKHTEESLTEAKLQADLYLDLMGHDINNMHQIALGYLEMARDMQPEADENEFLDKPIEVLQRSALLIKNVRKLQKLSEGMFQSQEVDVSEMLVNVQSEFGSLPHKAITLNINGSEHCYVRANELLHDVFANLVSNAIKHTGDKADIVVDLDVLKDNDSQYCRVSVGDSGPGIHDDLKGKIFNRMHKGSARGMGLGLYLVESLVESYKGKVWVEDRVPGDHTKGARFVVLLPTVEK